MEMKKMIISFARAGKEIPSASKVTYFALIVDHTLKTTVRTISAL
ncbi:MAG: hypothetical protein ACLU9S_07200 [Oscillospiraceae bacterium]